MKKVIIIMLLSFVSLFAIEHLTPENFDKELKGKNVIVDFYATWCPPCKIITENLNKFDEIKSSEIVIYKIDIDDQRELIKKFNVSSIPTLVFLDNGEIKYSQVGVQSVNELEKNTKKYLLK